MKNLLQIQKINPVDAEIVSPISLKILHNSKGRAIFLNSTESISTVAVVEYVPDGEVRGNHYHKNKREVLYIIEGKVKIYFWEPSSKEIEETILEKGHLITIEPNLGHAFKAIKPTLGFEMGSCPCNPDDTIYDFRIK